MQVLKDPSVLRVSVANLQQKVSIMAYVHTSVLCDAILALPSTS